MLKRLFVAFTVVCILGLHSEPTLAEPISVVADEWPPFSGADLPNGGISLDVISTVLRRAGYEVETAVLPWARIMDGSRRGEYDVVGSLFYDPDIATYMTYSAPFYQTEVRFAQRAGADTKIEGLESLKPYSIAVGDGFLYEENFDRATDLNKVIVTTALQGLQMVAYDRADLTLDSLEVLNYAVKVDDPKIADLVEFLPFVLAKHDIHMAISNQLPNKDVVLADFNRVLATMRDDGSLAVLLEKHVTQ